MARWNARIGKRKRTKKQIAALADELTEAMRTATHIDPQGRVVSTFITFPATQGTTR